MKEKLAKTIEIILNYFIVICISIATVFIFNWYQNKYIDKNKDILIVFSAKEIIENKKLNIKRAVLNNGSVKEEEEKLAKTIEMVDLILRDISEKSSKPIFQKEVVLYGNTKDITPLVEKALKDKGLL